MNAPGAAVPPASALERDALIFVPGMGRSWGDQPFTVIADKIVASFNSLTEGIRFTSAQIGTISYGTNGKSLTSRVVTIFREVQNQSVPMLDLYEFDYMSALV